MYISTRPTLGLAKWGQMKIYNVKVHYLFTNWCDLLDLSKQKKLLGIWFLYALGSRGGMKKICFQKLFLWNTLLISQNFTLLKSK